MVRRILGLTVLILLALLAWRPTDAAAQVPVTAQIVPADPKVGESFQYVIQSNTAFSPLEFPRTAASNVKLLSSRPSTLSQTNIVNGQQSVMMQCSWEFRAISEGPFTFEPVRIRIGGQEQTLPAVNGTVHPVDQMQVGDFKNIGHVRSRDRNILKQYGGRYFTVLEVSDENPYLYQPVSLTTVLYREAADQSLNTSYNINSPGGGSQVVPVAGSQRGSDRSRPDPVVIDGRNYVRSPLHTIMVVPTRTGEMEITGAEFLMSIGTDMFFAAPVRFMLTAPFRNITVKPLPAAPDNVVTQLVGDFTIGASVDREEVAEGDLVTLMINISGQGFLEMVSLDQMPEIDGLSFVSEEVTAANNQPDTILHSTKTFKRVYQVNRPGDIEVPSLRFAVLKPDATEFEIRDTEPVAIRATASAKSSIKLSAGVQERGKAREVGGSGGIIFIDETPLRGGAIAGNHGPIALRPAYIITHAAPLLLLACLGMWNARQRRLGQDVEAVRARELRGRAGAALKEARARQEKASTAEFYSALSDGIRHYVASIVRREAAGMTNEEAGEFIRKRGASEEVAREIVHLLDRCDEMRYAPGMATEERGADLKLAEGLLGSIGRLK